MELQMKIPVQISFLFFFCIFLGPLWELGMAQNSTAVIDVGVILDLDTWVGKMGQTCISMALSDLYQAHNYTTRLVLHTRDSKEDVVGAASEALDLLKNLQVKAIIGPESSAQAKFVADLGSKSQVPILSFSATSPSLSSSRNPYFIRTANDDLSQVKAIAAIVRAFGWREVVPIYEDTDYGRGIIPFLTDALQEIDAKVPYRSMIPSSATDAQILKELYKLKTMTTRVFVVHMGFSGLGSHFFSKVKYARMMSEGYVWITTNGITDFLDSMASSVIDSMHGVIGVKPYVPKSEKLNNFTRRWRRKILLENPRIEKAELSIIGLWAYDTVQALAMAVEQVGAMKSHFRRPEANQNSNDLSSLGVSETGPELLHAILNTTFEGLSGKFHLIGRQLPSSAFQIINVVGKGRSEIGFWTPVSGLSKVLNETSNKMYSGPMQDLLHVNWPGQSKTSPRGWVIAPNGKKLRIGVPVENEFSEILNVVNNSNGNVNATGFCIDVFDHVRKRLPYDLPYEFVRYENASRGSAGNYNDLVYQVFLQKYDAVVADTTIIANRSKHVDFTLPYTESGVSMLVPIKDDKSKNAWIFLKPLSRNLWLTSTAAFVVTGFVVWVLEHRINDDFRGPPAHQIGVMFWFSFSTLVFAHKEKVVSNLSRFVMIIWVFVVLILTSSYTASLTSMLTVRQLQPTVTDVKDLIRNGKTVGYKKDSFVLGLLKSWGFDDSKLRPLVTPEEYNEALSKGIRNDGVAAIFDEIPYIKLLLGKYCGRYMMVGPTYKTDGFGFVFPKGSPWVRDFSQAILEVREGDEMVKIEQKWFGQQANCLDPSPTDASNSLTLDSFWGLFLITGTASFLAFFICALHFLHKHWHVLTTPDDPETSFGCRLVQLLKHFDNKDLSYHTYKKAQPPGEGRAIGPRGFEEPSTLHTNGSESPLSMSNGSDFVGGEVGIFFPEIETPYQNTSADVPNNRNAIPGTVEMIENRI
ncbi:glutamate receptor 2.7-like [Magnolia sinica]|uniref:glutamate receptor 2.7-like n=1 Tax=Magnolia sinica TaxID=86752 RepID=UPI002658942D|nr:glutamate receptor 2.7-like [Magnolia sinica]